MILSVFVHETTGTRALNTYANGLQNCENERKEGHCYVLLGGFGLQNVYILIGKNLTWHRGHAYGNCARCTSGCSTML